MYCYNSLIATINDLLLVLSCSLPFRLSKKRVMINMMIKEEFVAFNKHLNYTWLISIIAFIDQFALNKIHKFLQLIHSDKETHILSVFDHEKRYLIMIIVLYICGKRNYQLIL